MSVNRGYFEQAESELRAALASGEAELGANHMAPAMCRYGLSRVLHTQGTHEEAELEARAVLAAFNELLPAGHPMVALPRFAIAAALLGQRKYEDAEVHVRAALSIVETTGVEPDSRWVKPMRKTLVRGVGRTRQAASRRTAPRPRRRLTAARLRAYDEGGCG